MSDTKALIAKVLNFLTTKSTNYTITGNVGTVYARRSGNVVSLVINSTSNKSYSTGYTTICTLGADYRPANTIIAAIMDSNTSTVSAVPMAARIYTSGEVQVYRYAGNGSSTMPRGTISYVV